MDFLMLQNFNRNLTKKKVREKAEKVLPGPVSYNLPGCSGSRDRRPDETGGQPPEIYVDRQEKTKL